MFRQWQIKVTQFECGSMVRSKSEQPGHLCMRSRSFQRQSFISMFQMAPEQECLQYHTASVRELGNEWIELEKLTKKNSDRNNRDVQLGFCHQRNHSGFHPNTFVQARIEFLI